MDEKQLFEQRKHMVLALMQDKTYVPMKQKELAIVMQVAREDREALVQVLDALLADGKIEVSKRGKYQDCPERDADGHLCGASQGIRFCGSRRKRRGYFHPGGIHWRGFSRRYGAGDAASGKNRKAPGRKDCPDSGAWNQRSDCHVSGKPELWLCSAR